FNLNVLKRINEEFDAGFELDKFEHYAFYNAQQGRIEMHLISLDYQRYELAGEEIVFSPGESIHTENSYKYAPNEFQTLTAQAGWETEQLWLAKDDMFSTFLLKS
ncbi:MAG: putative SAM-dependent methyltransferase, partial [Flavobacteriales bacterium]